MLLALLVALLSASAHAETRLDAQWRIPGSGTDAWQHVSLDGLISLPRDPVQGLDVRLHPASGTWPVAPWALVIRQPPLGEIDLLINGEIVDHSSLDDARQDRLQGSGRIVFEFRKPLGPSDQLTLHFGAHHSPRIVSEIAALSVPELLEESASWVALLSACLGLMLAMGVTTLVFSLVLRHSVFALHAGYVLCFVAVQALKTGFIYHPLAAYWIAPVYPVVGRTLDTLSLALMALFVIGFGRVGRVLPRIARALEGLAWLVPPTGIVATLWPTPLVMHSVFVVHVMAVMILVPLLWVSVILAARKQRQARLLMIGWTPLLLLQFGNMLQGFGVLTTWSWLYPGSMVASALEALVISYCLADEALAVRRARDRARALSDADPLTGALNRRAMFERLAEREVSGTLSGCAVFIDVDHFKAINDEQGHDAGDRALVLVAAVLREAIADADLLVRYGGEEFVLILAQCSAAEAVERVDGIQRELKQASREMKRPLTFSAGVARRERAEAWSGVLQRADNAMYQAKVSGRDRVVIDTQADGEMGLAAGL